MPEHPQFTARFTTADVRGRVASLTHPTPARTNLGAHDWTIECWLRLDANAGDEGTLFEVGTGFAGDSELVTRFSVLPRENAFVLASISNAEDEHAGAVTKRVEYANAEGPPVGVAFLRSTTLPLRGAALPRDAWFHVALVHSAATDQLRLFIGGRQRAVVVIQVTALPHGHEAYVSVACDGRGERVLAGALDELRITDEAVYAADFTPPESFSPGLRAAPSRSLPP